MDPIRVIALAFSLTSTALKIAGQEAINNVKDYGLWRSVTLRTVFVHANGVLRRVRRHILGGLDGEAITEEESAREAWKLKESYAASFTMVAVAGAIVAQIAITALSLPYLERTHWTAQAAFVISLISGLLSVYFACIIQQQLSGLHSPDEVRQWLTTTQIRRKQQNEQESGAPKGSKSYTKPSYHAALLLVVPAQLLNWSSVSLLVGIGIYYGLVHTEHLGSLRGENSNLAILIVYVLFTSGAIMSYISPWWQKELEMNPDAQAELRKVLSYNHRASGRSEGINKYHGSGDEATPAHQGSSNDTPRPDDISTPTLQASLDFCGPRIQIDDWAQSCIAPAAQSQAGVEPAKQLATSDITAANKRLNSEPSMQPISQHHYNDLATQAILDALQASISAQKASLRAQELLLQKYFHLS